MSRRRRRAGVHPFIAWCQGLLAAFRHVLTGGASTKAKAVRRAAEPPALCPTCRQPVPHSADWQHHYHL